MYINRVKDSNFINRDYINKSLNIYEYVHNCERELNRAPLSFYVSKCITQSCNHCGKTDLRNFDVVSKTYHYV